MLQKYFTVISLSLYRVAIIAHVNHTTRAMEKLVLWTMLVNLRNITVERKSGATVKVMETSSVK